jgi:hypothetical protein
MDRIDRRTGISPGYWMAVFFLAALSAGVAYLFGRVIGHGVAIGGAVVAGGCALAGAAFWWLKHPAP